MALLKAFGEDVTSFEVLVMKMLNGAYLKVRSGSSCCYSIGELLLLTPQKQAEELNLQREFGENDLAECTNVLKSNLIDSFDRTMARSDAGGVGTDDRLGRLTGERFTHTVVASSSRSRLQ